MSYRGSRGRSVGRIMHCLDVYCKTNDRLHEMATIDNGSVWYGDALVARYNWSDIYLDDTPHFIFYEYSKQYKRAKQFEEAQFRKKPYLDMPDMLYNLDYTIQEVCGSLSYNEALWLNTVRRRFPDSWWENVEDTLARVREIVVKYTSRYVAVIDDEMVRHIAECAIYDLRSLDVD